MLLRINIFCSATILCIILGIFVLTGAGILGMGRYFLLFFLLGMALHVRGQKASGFQVWSDITVKKNLGDKWTLGGDTGYRFDAANEFQLYYLRPGVRFWFSKTIALKAGTALFYTWNRLNTNAYELRTYEYAFLYWPQIGGFTFSHRLGLDQRWYFLPVAAADGFAHRFRYRLRLRSPEITIAGLPLPFYLSTELELLRNINDRSLAVIFDSERLVFALGGSLTTRLRAEVQYMLINYNDTTWQKFIREKNVLRIKVFYQFAGA